jgi:hypothetical protein
VLRIQTLEIPVDPHRSPPHQAARARGASQGFLGRSGHSELRYDTPGRRDRSCGARNGGGWPGNVNGYLAELWPNQHGLNKAELTLWTGSSDTPDPSFDFKPGTPYRFSFSGVGTRLSIELIDLELQQPAVAPFVVTNSNFSQGFVAFFMQSGAATCDMTLDSFFATGTKP